MYPVVIVSFLLISYLVLVYMEMTRIQRRIWSGFSLGVLVTRFLLVIDDKPTDSYLMYTELHVEAVPDRRQVCFTRLYIYTYDTR